jgi:predicted HNH restriction endonuclease
MQLIETLPELIKNILYLEQQLSSKKEIEKEKAINLIKGGICFVRYTEINKVYFAPSRFVGYKNNTLSTHESHLNKHGSTTNNRIKRILHEIAIPNSKLEKEYLRFCSSYGIIPSKTASFGATRKFWNLDNLNQITTNVYGDIELPEGKKKFVIHIRRERNPLIRQMAINNFLLKNKTLHCEACKFDFEKKYGKLGKDFIEAHHTIPLSKMKKGHTTHPNDIVLLCSNCHRMVHRSEKWLSLNELKKLLKL